MSLTEQQKQNLLNQSEEILNIYYRSVKKPEIAIQEVAENFARLISGNKPINELQTKSAGNKENPS